MSNLLAVLSRRLLFPLLAVLLVAVACSNSDNAIDVPNTVRPNADSGIVVPPETAPPVAEPVTSVVDDYQWSVLSSGAGGFVTGASSSSDGSTLVVRTDVGGAYRWDRATSSWGQMLNQQSVTDPHISDWNVESIAVAPSDPQRIVMSVGAPEPDSVGRILRSADGGATWTPSEQSFMVHGNALWRTNGERLAINSSNPDQVWLGTRTQGLWQSSDGGATFARVDAIPSDESEKDPAGVLFVVLDGSGSTIWVGVANVGIFRSPDGGETWSLISPSEGLPYDAELASDGRLWVAERDPGTIKIITGDQVTETEPQSGRRWETVAVDPFDPNHVIVGDEGVKDHLYQTSDGGSSWQRMDVTTSCKSIQWLDDYANDYLPTGSMLFDRAEPGKVWIPEGFAVWTAEVGSTSSSFAMTCETAGIEELVSNDAVAMADGSVITAHWDRSIFWHGGDDSSSATQGPTARFNTAWDLDTTPSDPLFVAATVGDQRFCCEGDGQAYQSGFSSDGGRTWQQFSSYGNGHPPDLRFGNIAVSANDSKNMVWLPTFNGPVHYTLNQGETWTPVILPGTEDMADDDGVYRGGSHGQLFLNRKVLAADRFEAGTFYLYHQSLGLFKTSDGGANWQLMASDGLPIGWTVGFFNATLIASPTDAGHLVFTPGVLYEGVFPAYESRDGGNNWTAIAGTSAVNAIGFGAPEEPGGSATLYLYGDVADERGLWRSADGFERWQLVSSAPGGNYQAVKAIAGHQSEFGTVYVGFSGTSFMVGRL